MDQSEKDEAAADRQSFLDSLRNSDPGFESKNTRDEEEITFEEQNADTIRATNLSGTPSSDLLALFQPPPNVESTPKSTNKNPLPPTSVPPVPSTQYNDTDVPIGSPKMRSPKPSVLRGPNRPQPISTRARSVSFDRRVLNKSVELGNFGRNRSDESSHGPSQLPLTSTPIDEKIALEVDVNPRDLWQQQQQQVQSERQLTIDDLLTSGAYELEAETNILRAFEEHQQRQPAHRREASGTSNSVFSGIPDALMMHDFSLDDENSDSTDRKTGEEEKTNSTDEDNEKIQRVPLVRSHRRQKSVGDQLVGLTLAMQTLEGKPIEDRTDTVKDGVVSGTDLPTEKVTRGRDRLFSLEEGLEALAEVSEESNHSDKSQAAAAPRLTVDSNTRMSVYQGAKNMVEDNEFLWKAFLLPRLRVMKNYVKTVGSLLVFLLTIAAVLFYFVGNPVVVEGQASISWYLVFCARQIITFSLALTTQVIIIDLLCVSTKMVLRLLGQYFTLLIIMSRGWPFVVFSWSLYNFGLLYGNRPFSKHWGFWTSIGLINESNPSGGVVEGQWNQRVLFIALFLSLATALKRFFVGLYLGRQTFGHYGPQLAKIMEKILVVSKVAHLANKLKRSAERSALSDNLRAKYADKYAEMRPVAIDSDDDYSNADSTAQRSGATSERTLDMNKVDPLTGRLDNFEKEKLMQLLGRWEEPTRESSQETSISIAEVLRFRKALAFINDEYPFSYAFGSADTRDATIRSAQQLYLRLLTATPYIDVVQFETIAEIALRHDGSIDEDKAMEAIRIFRPDREGNLTLIDFIKSVDSIYKEFRLLQASIQNSSQIDQAFESIFNVVFYGASVTIILSQIGVDPLSLFLSFSSILFAFAFMISSASSKYFEGLLFILVRRPYGIGDIIHIGDVQQDTSPDGSMGWIIRHVTLTHTIATWVPTMEQANFPNGSLSSSRIINWARSPNAKFNICLSFPISAKYETIEIFKRAVEEYLKVRPREWLILNGFRVQRIFAEKGYMEVLISVQHRDPWQNIAQVLDSKANFVTYCHEVQKKLGMNYVAPIVPIEVVDRNQDLTSLIEHQSEELSSVESKETDEARHDEEMQFQQFRSMARKKYKIRVT